MAQQLESNIEELKSVDRLRRELITNISHDLRTPIASIQGYIETILMKSESLSKEKKKKYLNTALKNSKKLNELINDLFQLSKLESQPNILKPEPLQIAELIQDVTEKYRLMANNKNIHLNTVYSKDLPMAFADIKMIDRVLQNLLDNALKFCKDGDQVSIELNQAEDNLAISVRDTGRGIAQEEIPFIFDKYKKDSTSIVNKEGSGLGLAIVKKIVDLHKGNISVSSEPLKGTTFKFTLPVYSVA